MQDSNETLFYRLMLDHVEEMLPIVYTPTVGLACQQFSHIYRRPRGLFVSYPLRDSITEILRNRPNPEVDVIVVTDGEPILGLGDQGASGLGIPIGKLSLYSLIGGIHPSRTLPIVLDVGTNNEERLRDPEYLGWRQQRVTGQEYLDFVDRFVQAVKQGIFSESIVREMARKTERPIIFPLTNPTSRSEAEPTDLLAWTEGRALVATGSPFAPVKYGGKTIEIAQCNNVFVFPAVGLGLLASSAWRVTNKMMLAGAKALGEQSPALRDATASFLPSIANIRTVALDIAYGVALQAQEEGLAPAQTSQALRQEVERSQWSPEYTPN